MPSAVELTDITSVRQFMQKSVSDKLQDEDLEVLIIQVSEAIQRNLNREFTASTGERTFELLPNTGGPDLLNLAPYEYREIHKVTLDEDLTPTELTTGQWRAWPLPSIDGTFFGIRFAELPEPAENKTDPFPARLVTIEADWGLGNVPPEVQHWANVAVEAWSELRPDAGVPNIEFPNESPLPTPTDLPAILRWRRPTPMA